MNPKNLSFIINFFYHLSYNLPSLIVCGIACILLTTRKSKIAGAPRLALWGFGLALGTGIVMPIIHTLLFFFTSQAAAAGGTDTLRVVMVVMPGLSLVSSLLQMSIYILLLMALLKPNPNRHLAVAQQGDPE
jgi:hypothetical protein